DIEYIVPRAFFEQNDCKVSTSAATKVSVGRFGYKVQNDHVNTEIVSKVYDALFLVGGAGSLQYLNDAQLKTVVETFLDANKPVAAICAAPRNLISWGLMRGKAVTAHNGDGSFPEFALQHGAVPQMSKAVVEDGLLLTGNGPEASEELALLLLKKLE
ncbi:MAG TPA: DJ-1/PfpI family protein, partial [Cytophagales bacterium]|nr:DJ-1/PfpI family protein [Cytophagales bacterium]